ncbi:MAG: MFS transporter [Marinosulfonomonas sp.]
MSFLRIIALSRAPIAALMAVGVFWGAFSALIPDIKASVGASDQQFGLALIVTSVGGMCSTYLVPRIGHALGRITLPVLGAILALAFFYPLLASNIYVLGVAFFFIGPSVSMLDISANVRISVLESRNKLHLMNFIHAMFSFAFAGSAFAAAMARKAGYGPSDVLPVMSLVCVGLVLLMWESEDRYGPPMLDAEEAPAGTKPPWTAIILTAIILFAAFLGENATEAWSALHIERTLGGAAGEGGLGPATLGLVMGVARLFGQVAAQRFGEAKLIFWSAVLGVIGTMVISLAPSQLVVLAGVAVVGLGMAVVVPSVNSMLGRLVREDQRAHAISRAWMFGMLGFFIGPSMMGIVSEYFGLRVAFFVVALVVAVMIPAILALAKQKRV